MEDFTPRQELDSTPVYPPLAEMIELESPTAAVIKDDFAYPTSPDSHDSVWEDESVWDTPQPTVEHTPRANLEATAYERRSKTYANSWTKFQGVQI
jgi:hypothetical protein